MSSSAGVVTLLFTDLVASTELLARVGDDAAEELRRVHFGLLRNAISTGGGQEVKTLGDGLMVAFTSSLQAIRSAVAIQQATEEHNGRNPELPLRVRIGLHAGEPVQADDDFHGTAVVIAKRLCDTADGGQILASDLVRELVGSRGGFSFRSAGRLRLKGLPEPVSAATVEWRAEPGPTATRRRSARPEARAVRGPRLVGRDQEMSILEEEFRRSAAGEFRCVLIVGDPGMGKTRLGAELLSHHRDDAIGLSARAHSLGTTSAFGVWAEALERHLRAMDATDIERLCAGSLDDLAQLLRSVAAIAGRGPEGDPPRSRLLEGLAVVTSNLTEDQPVVVVIDDVQNADPASLEALDYTAHSCMDDRILVVLTARTGEISGGSAAGEILLGLEQEGLLRRLSLGPLAEDGLRALAEIIAEQSVPRDPGVVATGAFPGESVLRPRADAGPARQGRGSLRPGARAAPRDTFGSGRRSAQPPRQCGCQRPRAPGGAGTAGRAPQPGGRVRRVSRRTGGDPGPARPLPLGRRGGARPPARLRDQPSARPGSGLRRDRSGPPAAAAPPGGPGPGLRRAPRGGGAALRPLGGTGRRRSGQGAPGRHPRGRAAGGLPGVAVHPGRAGRPAPGG